MSARATLAALGNELNPQVLGAVRALYDDEQQALARRIPATATDLVYGKHERHRLDVYAPQDRALRARPVFLWVHGGGFLRGDKGDQSTHWDNANVGRAAAALGMLGVVINYRLAPHDPWPAGSEDLAAAVRWAHEHASSYGGDPARIIVAGTSAGAVHVAGFLKLQPEHGSLIRGAVILSGLFGLTPLDTGRDTAYYGEDAARYPERFPLSAVVETPLPLLVACAQYDPPRFQEEFIGLLQQRLARHGRLPHVYMGAGHNHFSLAFHLGSSDDRLAGEIRAFVEDCCDMRLEAMSGTGDPF